MKWSHWRGAVALALLGWAGAAWTQNPAPRTVVGERVMVVNEGGRSVRCRIVSTWQLPDGKTAHQLQALDSGEMLTIVDDVTPSPSVSPASMPKRIFRWGASKTSPPVGVPVPSAPDLVPQELKIDSGVVLNHVAPPPAGMQTVMIDGKATTIVGAPTIINESSGEGVMVTGAQQSGPKIIQETLVIVEETPAKAPPTFGAKLFGRKSHELETTSTTLMPRPNSPSNPLPYSAATDRTQPLPAVKAPDPKTLAINHSPLPPVSRKEESKSSFSLLEQATKRGDVVKLPVTTSTPVRTQTTTMQPANDWPLGSQSALAAKSGLHGPISYIPVPLVTVPNPARPPVPPEPKVPDAPKLNAFVNAFTPPVPREAMEKQQQAMMMQQGIMPPQQGMMMPPQQGYAMNPHQMQQQMMMQQAMMQQQMRPPVAISPYRQAISLNYAARYNGPQAPNPLGGGQPVAPAGFYPPMMQMPPMQGMPMQGMPMQGMMPPMQGMAPPVQPVAFQQPTTPAAPTATSELVSQWTKLLKESPYPAQREQAAHTLATHDWRANPQVLTALIDAAKNDPAASVRVGCVYALGRTSAATEAVFGALQSLRSDSDERVRQEVDSALSRLQRGSSSASAN